jgi:hypothetical protein
MTGHTQSLGSTIHSPVRARRKQLPARGAPLFTHKSFEQLRHEQKGFNSSPSPQTAKPGNFFEPFSGWHP